MGLIGIKGQAAITDALYFLLIVTGLTIFLFTFGNLYGTSVTESIEGQFTNDYTTSALKTILYSSTPRDPTLSIDDPDVEIDALLAYIKEDYADGAERSLELETKLVIAQDINAVMNPVASAYDYIFYIYRPSTDESIYAYLHLSKIVTDPQYSTIVTVDISQAGHINYICDIPDDVLSKINTLSANAGSTALSSATIKLAKVNPDTLKPVDETARASLLMWQSQPLELVFKPGEAGLGWGCCEFDMVMDNPAGCPW